MLRAGYGDDCITPRLDLGGGIFLRFPWDEFQVNGVYVTHYLPVELLRTPSQINIREPEIVRALEQIREFAAANPVWAIMFLLNLADYPLTDDRAILPQYDPMVKELGIRFSDGARRLSFGNLDSFVEQMPEATESGLKVFLQKHKDGITISLNPDDISVNRFSFDKPVSSGVARQSLSPYEPLFIYDDAEKEAVLREFEQLISKNAAEHELEKFLVRHYKEIFGVKYDRIEAQLWLRFPDLDIAGKNRRIDLFLRNTVTSDWELFEVKRAIRLTRDYRDAPVIAAEVSHAMSQIKGYARILSQDTVRRKFAAEGIEYYEPELHLVIGRQPQLSVRQWRQLVVDNSHNVKLMTFDDLLKEMKLRLEDRYRIG